MPDTAILKRLAVLGAMAAGGLLVVAPACQRRQRTESAPDVAPLKAVLQKAAEEKLASPSMAAATLQLTPAAGRFDEEVSRVEALARESGGTALAELRDGGTRVLAQIPAASVTTFCQRVSGGAAPPPITKSGDPSEWIEVMVVRRAEE